jgi:hypothetical protein
MLTPHVFFEGIYKEIDPLSHRYKSAIGRL